MTALATPVQLDLFSAVLHAYTAEHAGRIDNGTLYEQVAARTGIDVSAFAEKTPVGKAQQPHSLLARAVRWHRTLASSSGWRAPGALRPDHQTFADWGMVSGARHGIATTGVHYPCAGRSALAGKNWMPVRSTNNS